LSYRLNNIPDKGDLEAVLDTERENFSRLSKSGSQIVAVFKDSKYYGLVSMDMTLDELIGETCGYHLWQKKSL
jgi:hypothetical protein